MENSGEELLCLEREFMDRMVTHEFVHENQGELVMDLNFYQFAELIDINPDLGSHFIHSMSEPFSEEDTEDKVMHNWLNHFKMRFHQLHASGHMNRQQKTDLMHACKVFWSSYQGLSLSSDPSVSSLSSFSSNPSLFQHWYMIARPLLRMLDLWGSPFSFSRGSTVRIEVYVTKNALCICKKVEKHTGGTSAQYRRRNEVACIFEDT